MNTNLQTESANGTATVTPIAGAPRSRDPSVTNVVTWLGSNGAAQDRR